MRLTHRNKARLPVVQQSQVSFNTSSKRKSGCFKTTADHFVCEDMEKFEAINTKNRKTEAVEEGHCHCCPRICDGNTLTKEPNGFLFFSGLYSQLWGWARSLGLEQQWSEDILLLRLRLGITWTTRYGVVKQAVIPGSSRVKALQIFDHSVEARFVPTWTDGLLFYTYSVFNNSFACCCGFFQCKNVPFLKKGLKNLQQSIQNRG